MAKANIVRLKTLFHLPTPQISHNYGMKGASISLSNAKLKLKPTPVFNQILNHNRITKQNQLQQEQIGKQQIAAVRGLSNMIGGNQNQNQTNQNQNQSLKGASSSLGIRKNNEGIKALKGLRNILGH